MYSEYYHVSHSDARMHTVRKLSQDKLFSTFLINSATSFKGLSIIPRPMKLETRKYFVVMINYSQKCTLYLSRENLT